MIKAYQYINTVHSQLHEYVMAFFLKIESDTNGFRDELFDPEFLVVVNHHPNILKKRFESIYTHVSSLSLTDRKFFCQRVIESNQIERICRGEYRPEVFFSNPTGINKTLKDLFLALYNQVLDGKNFQELIKSCLRDHFDQFCNANKDITLCPICGIGELKKSQDKHRDQYDHYLPKSLYPFSSVNFHNLVLCCIECNSFSAKGNKDTIAVSTGRIFFPYDNTHKGITLEVTVKEDNSDIEKIDWQLTFTNPDNKDREIESWKIIYSIEDRYQGHIKARIKNWYKHYFEYMKKPGIAHSCIEFRKQCYIDFLEGDENLFLNFIKKPALEGLFFGSNIAQAEIEALNYQ